MIILLLMGIAGVAVFALTFVPGFFKPGSRVRLWARLASGVVAVPFLLIVSVVLLLTLTIFKEPPSLNELQHEFPYKKADLGTIIRMSDEDATFSRIAPTFLDQIPETANGFVRQYMDGDPKAALPEPRWDTYRALFSRNGIKLGVSRNKYGDVFIMVDSVGLLNRGHVSGYLNCRSTYGEDDSRFEPCVLRTEIGQRAFNPEARQEACSFRRIDTDWYVYDQGPS